MIKSLFAVRPGKSEDDKSAVAGFFAKFAEARKSGALTDTALDGVDRTQVAAAVLMVEVARLDTDYSGSETDRICSIMQREFGMSLDQASELLNTAEERHSEAYTNWLFTKTIKEKAGLEERATVMEHLWDIAYADGELHELEADLLLRIGQAMELPEHERIKALERMMVKRVPELAENQS